MAFLLGIILLLEVQGTSCLWTVSKITGKSGGFVTIPCHYHRLYRDNPKYWCKGKTWSTCVQMRPVDQMEKKTGVSFHNSPDELVLTMTLTNIRSSDSNRYWCAVKKKRFLNSDMRISLELIVTEGTPDLSAAVGMLSSEEGGNITVDCIYSQELKDTEKKWCKSGFLHTCQSAQDIEPSADAAVQINDTNDGVFRVILTGLKKTYAGWYWCMAGELQAPVYINITSAKPNSNNTGSSTYTIAPWSSSTLNSFSDVKNHTDATVLPATSKLPARTSYENKKMSTASPEHPTTIHSSRYPNTTNNKLSHRTDTVTLLITGSATRDWKSNSAVTASSKDPKSSFKARDPIWAIGLVCGALLLVFILPGISWKLWSWHKKSKAGEEATEIITPVRTNDRDDLLNNEWTATSVAWIDTSSDTILITHCEDEMTKTQRSSV